MYPSLVRNRGTSKTTTFQAHKTQKRRQKVPKTPFPEFPMTGTDKPCAHVGKQRATPVLNKRQEETCCLIHRNVMLIRSCSRPGIRTMKKLVLTSAIHDKNVTMAKPAQVSLIIRTGPTPPSEDCAAAKTHRNNELVWHHLTLQTEVRHHSANQHTSSIPDIQVRGGRHLSLSTPRLHQVCDGPPHTFKQWPASPSSVWPYSGAPPIRI